MRLEARAVRELRWHKQAEWSYMLRGKARITAVDEAGRTFADDLSEGDFWYFPAGITHSIQGIESDVNVGRSARLFAISWREPTTRPSLSASLCCRYADVADLTRRDLRW